VTFESALHFLSVELFKAVAGGKNGDIEPTVLPIILRFGELAATVANLGLRILLNTPVSESGEPASLPHNYKPFGETLTTEADKRWCYSLRVDAALENPKYAAEARAILEAMEFEDRDLGSMGTRNRNAQCGLNLGAPYQRRGPLHYINTHTKAAEGGSCSSCAQHCTSIHCRHDAEEGEGAEEGERAACSHSYKGRGGFSGGVMGALGWDTYYARARARDSSALLHSQILPLPSFSSSRLNALHPPPLLSNVRSRDREGDWHARQ
jgi:hypothetical protein